jgi:hypothetical protein
MDSYFFRVKPGQVRTMVLLCGCMALVLFWPGIKSALVSVVVAQQVHSGKVSVQLPMLWRRFDKGPLVMATHECLSILCTESTSSLLIEDQPPLAGRTAEWRDKVEGELRSRGFGSPAERRIGSREGEWLCLQATSQTDSDLALVDGLIEKAGLTGEFQGAVNRQQDFYNALASVKLR